MADLQMVKRKAMPGEVGLFVNSEVWDDEFRSIKMDAEVTVKATTKAHQKYMRLSWHIARLVCDASDAFEHPEDARDYILIECKHYRRRFDKLRDKAELIPKDTHNLDGTAWLRLIPRMVDVAVRQFGIPEEAMSRQLREAQQGDARPEPPPHEEVPDGPTAAHGPDTSPEASANQAHEQDQPPAEAAEPAHEPEPAAPTPEPAPAEAPQRRQRKAAEPEPELGPEPPAPTDVPSYEAWILWHCKRATDAASFIVFFNGDDQWNMRKQLGIGVIDRKAIEAKLADRFPEMRAQK